MFYLYALLLDACFCPPVQLLFLFVWMILSFSLPFPFVGSFLSCSLLFALILLVSGHRWPSSLFKFFCHSQELHAHNHIHSVRIAVDLANFFVYVCNQFVSLLCRNVIIYLSFYHTKNKIYKTERNFFFVHRNIDRIFIYLLGILIQKPAKVQCRKLWIVRYMVNSREKKKHSIHFRETNKRYTHNFNITWMFHWIFINWFRW